MTETAVLVPVLFKLPERPVVLGQRGEILGQVPGAKDDRKLDFWFLREKLLSSKTREDLVEFLNECGYGCVTRNQLITRPWTLEHLSPNLSDYLLNLKQLLIEWMPLPRDRWRKLQGRFSAKLLEYVCLGTGRSHALRATFGWSAAGEPSVTVFANDPLEAIVITVHIDRLRHVRFKSCA